jgi:CRP-like cAMP-binding protein
VTHDLPLRDISDSAALALQRLATVTGYGTGEAVYRYGDRLEFWYGVTAGAARKFSLTSNGGRRIVDFLLPGDLFGFGMASRHWFSVEAIAGGTAIARYPRVDAERLADSNPDIGRRIRLAAFDSLNRMQSRMVLLGRASAVEKLSIFLLEMADRNRVASSTDMILLPMSRYDIADYLAIAVETVSRALTQLRCEGVIRLAGLRTVRVSDRQLLRRIADKIE